MNLVARYKRLTLWNKLGVWGSAASIMGLIFVLWQYFPSGGDTGTHSDTAPHSIDLNDPRLKLLRSYDLRKEVGATLDVGSCPKGPCFRLLVDRVNLTADPPYVHVVVSGFWAGNEFFNGGGLGTKVPLLRGCYFTLATRDLDLRFEVEQDTVASLRAWAAIFQGSYDGEGSLLNAGICPNDVPHNHGMNPPAGGGLAAVWGARSPAAGYAER